MNFLHYILRIGIIYFFICCISPVLAILTGLIGIPLHAERYTRRYRILLTLSNAISFYFLVSLVSILTISSYQTTQSLTSLILFSLIGTAYVFWIATKTIYEKQKAGDYQTERDLYGRSLQLHNDSLLSIAAPAIFILTLFLPPLAFNRVTLFLFQVLDWAYHVRILGWILGLVGVLLMIALMEDGFFAIITAAILGFSAITSRRRTDS